VSGEACTSLLITYQVFARSSTTFSNALTFYVTLEYESKINANYTKYMYV